MKGLCGLAFAVGLIFIGSSLAFAQNSDEKKHGSSSKQPSIQRAEENMDKTKARSAIPDWVAYPEEEWVRITPAQAGFDAAKFNEFTSQV